MIPFLEGAEVERRLPMAVCIDAVEKAFRTRASGGLAPSAVLGIHVDGGGFHVKAAAMDLGRRYFAAKINANFPANPRERGLPTIQGVLALFDATNGVPLVLMDSMAITTIRTAAATAVAARHLAAEEGATLAIIGCGVQARAHVEALRAVRPISRIIAFDRDAETARQFAAAMADRHGIDVRVAGSVNDATYDAALIVTCTTSTSPIVDIGDAQPGAFIGAVGADNESKWEIAPALMAKAGVVVDDLKQCVAIGDLHHAIDAGAMRADDVRGDLADVVAGRAGRRSDDEIIVFDSTGVAIEDVAAAAAVYESS